LTDTAYAQRRGGGRGAAGGRSVVGGGARTVVVASPYYSPYFYDPLFFDPWYGDPLLYGYPPGAGLHDPSSALRLQVDPPQTEVFVDGYYAGSVDAYDGVFQRLRLDPGEHDLELYLQGFKGVRQTIFLQPDQTFRIRHSMQALAPGEPQQPRPAAPPPPSDTDPAVGNERSATAPMRAPIERAPGRRTSDGRASGFGAIAIRVQPPDAEVLVDGERWDGPAAGERLTIQLAEGSHRVEIRKAGFRSFTTITEVRRGETATLNVSLTQE
jgi:PEGA domain-containing protein